MRGSRAIRVGLLTESAVSSTVPFPSEASSTWARVDSSSATPTPYLSDSASKVTPVHPYVLLSKCSSPEPDHTILLH